MDDLLTVNQVASLLNLVQCRLQVLVPRVELLISELFALINGDDAGQTIDLGSNAAINDHVSQFVLSALHRDTNELAHALKAHSAVVLLDHAQVVLDELSNQLDHMILAVQSLFLERLERGH